MVKWIDIALSTRVFGSSSRRSAIPRGCDRVHAAGGVVYHDVTERNGPRRRSPAASDGLIAVNNRAGGHAGGKSPANLFDELALRRAARFAGGVGTPRSSPTIWRSATPPQMGTRLSQSTECKASDAYKQAIADAGESDIVFTERLTGLPVAVINNDYIRGLGTKAGPFARWMLKGHKTKHWMRTTRSESRVAPGKRAHEIERRRRMAGRPECCRHPRCARPAGEIVREYERRRARRLRYFTLTTSSKTSVVGRNHRPARSVGKFRRRRAAAVRPGASLPALRPTLDRAAAAKRYR